MGFGGIFGGPGAFKVVKGSKQLNGVSKKKAAKRGEAALAAEQEGEAKRGEAALAAEQEGEAEGRRRGQSERAQNICGEWDVGKRIYMTQLLYNFGG
jgi:hypothetical protein